MNPVTLKDVKGNFHNNLKCRLINPAKPEIGTIIKSSIEKINDNIKKATNMNQRQSLQTIITWFKSNINKGASSFIKFYFMDFYSSITNEILIKSINYGKAIITIEEEVRKTIFHARTSPLFDKNNIWLKTYKSGFDLTMGVYYDSIY